MHTTFRTETHEIRTKGVLLKVTNISPVYQADEKSFVKKKIEAQLYDVFCKYISAKP